MSGTTMSTPSSSDSGNIRPQSMTMMSSPQRMAMQFMPNSPRPPKGTIWSFPEGTYGTSMLTRHAQLKLWRQLFAGRRDTQSLLRSRSFLFHRRHDRLLALSHYGFGDGEINSDEHVQEPCQPRPSSQHGGQQRRHQPK